MSKRAAAGMLLALVLGILAAGCGEAAARAVFPKDNAVPGWTKAEHTSLAGDALGGLGAAAEEYAVESVERQAYQKAGGETLEVQIWRAASPAEAYGLWSALRSGSRVDGMGNNADSDGTRRLGFWQERFFVQVLAGQTVSAEELNAFGAAAAKGLPTGGRPPALVEGLPQGGLDADSVIYFHTQAAILKELDLGGEEILGMAPKNQGVLAGYTIDGQAYQLLLVEYPQAADTAGRLAVLQNAGLAGLLVSGGKDARLGAVFGKESSSGVVELLHEALTP